MINNPCTVSQNSNHKHFSYRTYQFVPYSTMKWDNVTSLFFEMNKCYRDFSIKPSQGDLFS